MRRSLGRGLSQLLSQTPPPPSAVEKPTPPKPAAKALPKIKNRTKALPKTTSKPQTNGIPTVIEAKPTSLAAPPPSTISLTIPEPGPAQVSTEVIRPNSQQPRKHFEDSALHELAESIKEVGVLQPLIVREIGGGHYELIAGERRLRAAKLAGVEKVPVVIRKESHQGSLEIALIENIQREDIGPLEAARAYQRLLDEFDMTQESVAQRVGKSRPAIANSVRLLRLPSRVQEGLETGLITEGHARALLSVEDPTLQLALFEKIVAEKLSVREAEDAVRPGAPTKSSGPKAKQPRQEDPAWDAIRQSLSERFGSPVKLHRNGNRGKLVIEFFNEDDLDRILEAIGIRL